MNPILAIAQRLAAGSLSPEELPAALQSLSDKSTVTTDLLNDTVETVLTSSPIAPLSLILATIRVLVVMISGIRKNVAHMQAWLGHYCLSAGILVGEQLDQPAEFVHAKKAAIWLYETARRFLPSDDVRVGMALLNEGAACAHLAEAGVDSKANCRKSIALCGKAASCFPPGSPETGRCRVDEAYGWKILGHLGVEPEANYRRGIVLLAEAASCFLPGSKDAGTTLLNQAVFWAGLANMGLEAKANHRKVIAMFAKAMRCFPPDTKEAGICWMNAASNLRDLADLGVKPESNCRKAIALCARAAPCFSPGSQDAGSLGTAEANVWKTLAGLGVESAANLRRAIALYGEAASCFPHDSPHRGICCESEANAWAELATVEKRETGHHLEKALRLHERALRCCGEGTFDRAKVAFNCAGVLRRQAELTTMPVTRDEKLRASFMLLRKVTLPTFERIGGTFRNERERRAFREMFRNAHLRIVTVLLEIARRISNAEQAQALRWEAWQWVQRGKARTLQESLTLFHTEALEHDPALAAEFDEVLTEFSKMQDELDGNATNRGKEGTTPANSPDAGAITKINALLARLNPTAGTESGVASVPERDHLVAALIQLGGNGRRVVVAEFFSAEDGAIGVLLYAAGEPRGLRHPVRLVGGHQRAAELAKACQRGSQILSKAPSRRARDSAVKAECLPTALTDEAKDALEAVAAGLGEMLAPVREAIAAAGWQGTTLVLCPTGMLHLLPLAAAHWGTEEDGSPRPLIAAHPLVHLPTAALAVEVVRRQRPLSVDNRTAYIAAADRWGRLSGIYGEANDAKTKLEARGFKVRDFSNEKAGVRTIWEHGPEAWIVHLAMHSGMHERFELCGAEFHDRRLTVLELLVWLHFRHAALAIVATCSSSQPLDLVADDPSALTRAWMLAGAQSVIGGLWPLGDEAARQFSAHFYQEWALSGQPLAEAVRTAILGIRTDFGADDIYAWAPFVLVGHGATQLA